MRFPTAMLLACVPELVMYSPSPVIGWDPSTSLNIAGYVVYHTSDLSQTFQPISDIPCYFVPNEDLGTEDKICPTYYVPQRGLGGELVDAHFCVRAYNFANELSVACSNVVSFCMPEIWQPGEVYSENKSNLRVVRKET